MELSGGFTNPMHKIHLITYQNFYCLRILSKAQLRVHQQPRLEDMYFVSCQISEYLLFKIIKWLAQVRVH